MVMSRLTEEELAEAVADSVNAMGFDNEKFADALLNKHRTLQQSTFRMMLATIKAWSEQDHYDLRNEYTVEKSKEIMKALGDETHVPMI